MEKTKEIVILEHKEPIVTYVCDTCGKEFASRDYGAIKHCAICGKDVCHMCAIQTDEEYLEHGAFIGDYPSYYCPSCWKLGEDIREEIISLRNDAGLAEQELWQKWHQCIDNT